MKKDNVRLSEPNVPFSENHIRLISIVILCLYPLVGMGIDLIAPSLPAISHDLNVSNNFSKNLITIYLVGYVIGIFFIGFLSDALGHRKLMLLGFLAFVVVSLLPALIVKPLILLFSRFFQGFTIAAFIVLSRAVLSDILSKERLIRMATMVSTMWGIGPIIGPIIGGYLQYYFNWQACFYFFAYMGFLGLVGIIFIVPETHFHRQPLQFRQLKNNFITIVTHRLFLGIAMLMGVSYSLLIVFNTLGPFLIQSSLGYSSVYFGYVALLMGLTFLSGTFFCRQLLQKFLPENILFYAISFFILISIIAVIVALINKNNIWVVIISSLFMFLGCGIIYPVAMGIGLLLFRHLAGSGSAVMSLINILITSLTASIMSFLNVSSDLPLTLIYFGLMTLSGIIYFCLIKSTSINQTTS